MTSITENLTTLRNHITDLNLKYNTTAKLIAVSKTYPVTAIIEAYQNTQRQFGENYAQELAQKAHELSQLTDIEWHFIGTIQSNKTKLIAENAAWVHTLTKLQHALRLNNQRPANMPPLQVLIEVNISNEASKGGLSNLADIIDLANKIKKLPNLNLRGLMGMAANCNDENILASQFDKLKLYLQELNNLGFNLDQLSSGMSNDYPIAIAHGATLVRIGSKIFGERNYAK